MFKKLQMLGKAIKAVKPNVPKTTSEKLKSKLKIKQQELKGAKAKLAQTLFEKQNPKFKGKDFTFKTKTGKSESNRERYKRIQKENTKAFKGMIDKAFKNVKDEKKATGGRVGKMGGGMMGRRFGYSKGTPKPKTNVQKIKETFAPKGKIKFDAKKSDLDKSGSLSPYEKRRGMAIAKAMAKRKKKA